jgi:hypothetical protein
MLLSLPPTARPHVRASLMQHSQASLPVVSRKTRLSGGGRIVVSSSTSLMRISVGKQYAW